MYATGDEPDAARLSGINTDRTLLAVYTLAGLICAIAGGVLIGRIGGVSPQAGQTANLDSITAVVIGGTSLFGGRGSIVGTLFGALIVASECWQRFNRRSTVVLIGAAAVLMSAGLYAARELQALHAAAQAAGQ